MSRLCTHNGTVEHDDTTDEWYCTRCGDVVPEPERIDEEDYL